MKIKEEFILREIMDEFVLVPVGKTAEHFYGMASLNEVGARIWKMLPDAKDEEELVQALLQEYDVAEDELRADVTAFLDHLREENILE